MILLVLVIAAVVVIGGTVAFWSISGRRHAVPDEEVHTADLSGVADRRRDLDAEIAYDAGNEPRPGRI